MKSLMLLPKKPFISHSYADSASINLLIQKLPNFVKPLIFPPIQAMPDELVSTRLIQEIRDCDGMIYLKGGHSDKSPWVAFEKDYALRLNKPLFSFDISSGQFEKDNSKPSPLLFYFISHLNDEPKVMHITKFVLEARHFDATLIVNDMQKLAFVFGKPELADRHLEEVLNSNGYIIVFWSSSVLMRDEEIFNMSSAYVRQLMYTAIYLDDRKVLAERMIFVRLDDTQLPLVAVQNNLRSIKMYGNEHQSWAHFVDQLIVYLFWLSYQNT